MMAELEANKEGRERQETHIAEFTEAVTSFLGQVEGKCSNLTAERSTGAGGGGGGLPPPIMHGAAGGITDPGDSEVEEVTTRDEEGGIRDPTNKNKNPAEKKHK